ncbi:CBS domain-containing protein [Parafrankia sp. FMc2]|uniref:CBS domain-containing protein n=1 Tax=Parafrankia sp. FMc2 TaxID=3233196 RepID=UPI0034D67AA0
MDDINDILTSLVDSELTIRQLLERFGHRVRSPTAISAIRVLLSRAGLTTEPTFETGPLDTQIKILSASVPQPAQDDGPPVSSSQEAPATEVPDPSAAPGDTTTVTEEIPSQRTADDGTDEPAGQETAGEYPDEELPSGALRVGDLLSGQREFLTVGPQDSLDRAITCMLQWDYSQIPVLEGKFHLHGVVTWQSVAMLYAHEHTPTLAKATDDDVQVVHDTDSLLATLATITASEYVLVRNQQGEIRGIVTMADIATRFGDLARPFFVIGEIERLIRSFLAPVFDHEPAVTKKGKKITAQVADMTFGAYQHLLEVPENWQRLGWPFVDQKAFVDLLDDVRNIRNAVAHFRAEPLTSEENLQIHQLHGMLKKLAVYVG